MVPNEKRRVALRNASMDPRHCLVFNYYVVRVQTTYFNRVEYQELPCFFLKCHFECWFHLNFQLPVHLNLLQYLSRPTYRHLSLLHILVVLLSLLLHPLHQYLQYLP